VVTRAWGTYIIENPSGLLYTGVTTQPGRRLQLHNEGNGAKYTKGKGPWTLVYWERLGSQSDALKREYEIKQLTKTQKRALINALRGPEAASPQET